MEGLEVVKSLLETNAKLTEQIIELSRLLAEAKTPAPHLPQEFSAHPLWVPETEEDAQHALAAGLIDKDEYEHVLKEIGFMNAEITVPSPL